MSELSKEIEIIYHLTCGESITYRPEDSNDVVVMLPDESHLSIVTFEKAVDQLVEIVKDIKVLARALKTKT